MHRFLPTIVLCAVAAACHRTEAASPDHAGAAMPEVKVEVLSKRRMDSLDGELFVAFAVTNETERAIVYPGWAEDVPAISVEVEEAGAWSDHQVGWCGTGLIDFTLRPGARMVFDLKLPADGRTYRARFGEPPIVTPPVVATVP